MMKPSQQRLVTLHHYASDWMQVVVGKTFQFSEFRSAYKDARTSGTLRKAVLSISS